MMPAREEHGTLLQGSTRMFFVLLEIEKGQISIMVSPEWTCGELVGVYFDKIDAVTRAFACTAEQIAWKDCGRN